MEKTAYSNFWKILFYMYLALLIYFVLLKSYDNLFDVINNYQYKIRGANFIPVINVKNILVNIICFFPMGFLVPIVILKNNPFVKTILFSLLISILIELLQFATHLGILDINDVISNVCGAFIGYSTINIYKKLFAK